MIFKKLFYYYILSIPDHPAALIYFFTAFGSWTCILVCCVIAAVSRALFAKTFAHLVWKGCFFLFAVVYAVFFIANGAALTVASFAAFGDEALEGEELMRYGLIQLLYGPILFLFTVAYCGDFLRRLFRRGVRKKKADIAGPTE